MREVFKWREARLDPDGKGSSKKTMVMRDYFMAYDYDREATLPFR